MAIEARAKIAAPTFSDEHEPVEPVSVDLSRLKALTRAPLPPLQPPSLSVAVDELLGFDPRYIPSLLAPTTLVCRREEDGGLLVITTSKVAYAAARVAALPVFMGSEIEPLTVAAEQDRGTPTTIEEWCRRKGEDPSWKLTLSAAMGAMCGEIKPLGWTLGRVLQRYWLDLVEVDAGDDLPACLSHVAMSGAGDGCHQSSRAAGLGGTP